MTKDSITEEALMRIGITDVTNEIGDYMSDAMSQWAKQQAIAFAAFTAENLWAVYSKTGMWYQHMNEDNPITGEQLYNQFIEQQNK